MVTSDIGVKLKEILTAPICAVEATAYGVAAATPEDWVYVAMGHGGGGNAGDAKEIVELVQRLLWGRVSNGQTTLAPKTPTLLNGVLSDELVLHLVEKTGCLPSEARQCVMLLPGDDRLAREFLAQGVRNCFLEKPKKLEPLFDEAVDDALLMVKEFCDAALELSGGENVQNRRLQIKMASRALAEALRIFRDGFGD